MSILKTKISKEDFKTALSSCYKEAWIFSSKENLKQALAWKNNKSLIYMMKAHDDIDDSSDDNFSTASIDIFDTYKDQFENLMSLEENFLDEPNFSVREFLGEPIEDGNQVGLAAQELFILKSTKENLIKPKTSKCLSFNDFNFKQGLEKTNELLDQTFDEQHLYLFEPCFEFDNSNLKIRCDILKLKQNKHVDLIEVKATSKVKSEHIFDVMYQKYVLEKNGYIVDDIRICHLDNTYFRGMKPQYSSAKDLGKEILEKFQNQSITFDQAKSEFLKVKDAIKAKYFVPTPADIDYEKLFFLDEYSHGTAKQRPTIKETIDNFTRTFNLDFLFKQLATFFSQSFEAVEQDFKTNPFCLFRVERARSKDQTWKHRHTIDDPFYCHHAVKWFDTEQPNVFSLTKANMNYKAQIYWMSGKPYLKDFQFDFHPFDLKKDQKSFIKPQHLRILSSNHAFDNTNDKNDPSLIINPTKQEIIKVVLENYHQYPVFMYDFETVKWAIPYFDRSCTYQQIPFQYSIDVIEDDRYDYNKPETMKHYQFIGNDRNDPRIEFVLNFLSAIFENEPGKYVAYNMSFENSVLKYLALCFPELELPLMYVVKNTIDLLDFFVGNKKTNEDNWFLVYHQKFQGSYSIKKTQPALDNSFSYNDLQINKGDKASQVFRQYIEGDFEYNQIEWEKIIKQDMLKYCNRDTLAMVVILKQIQLAVKKLWGENSNEKI